tara:strand:+ start:1361 stop:3466 length:2106 start_codon:yes stop_codon:yes gene_type:complete
MITDLDKILVEWSYRTSDGKPDVKNSSKLILLEGVLSDFGWSREARAELLNTLMEAPENKPLSKQDREKVKKMGLIWKGKGYGKENEKGISFKNDDGRLVKVDKGGDDKKSGEKLDEPSEFDRDVDSNKGVSPDFKRPTGGDGEEKDDGEADKSKEKKYGDMTLKQKIRDRIAKNAAKELNPKERISNEKVKKEVDYDEAQEKILRQDIIRILPPELKKAAELEGSFKDNQMLLTAYGTLYGARVNSGFLKNSYNKVDVDQLRRNENNLKELYDEAKPEKVERGVRKVRKEKVSEEDVIETFDALPPKLQQYLMGAGQGGEAFIGDKHFLGYKRKDGNTTSDVSEFENGDYDFTQPESDTNKRWKSGKSPEVVRGNVGSKARGYHVWRVYKEQGGVCAYSGLPLVLEEMDLEHVVGLKNNDDGDPGTQEKRDREHGANQVLTHSKFNQIKKDMSMNDWIEKRNKPLYDKKQSDFDALEKGKGEANQYKSTTTQTALTQMDEIYYEVAGGKTISKSDYDALPENQKPKLNLTGDKTPVISDAKLGDKVTVETLDSAIKEEIKKYDDLEKNLLEGITDPTDRKKVKTLKTKVGKRLIQSMGLSGQFAADRRSVSMSDSDSFFQAYALAMASASPEDRPKYKKAWNEARAVVNQKKNKKLVIRPAKGKKSPKSEQMRKFKEIIKSKNLIPKEILDNERFSKAWG